MSNFYTNVQAIGGKILYRGIMDGKRIKQKVDYEPSLYLPAKKDKLPKKIKAPTNLLTDWI